MASQSQTIVKQRTIQSIEKEIEFILALYDDLECQIVGLIEERRQMMAQARGAEA